MHHLAGNENNYNGLVHVNYSGTSNKGAFEKMTQ